MPMRHLGFSLFGEHYSLVRSTDGTIREPSYAGLIRVAGRFVMHPELHDVLGEIGSLKQISAYLIDKRGFPGFDL